jgi:hypothetical protein
MSAGYALIVAKVAMEDRTALMHVLAVHRDLPLDEAMRLLADRPPGTVGHLRRQPADLPAPGEVLRLEAEIRWPGTPASNGVAARRERRQRAMGGKA